MTSPAETELRTRLVDTLRRSGIADTRVLDAIREIPRHHFVPEEQRSAAYEDRALPIGEGQTISQPLVVAMMAEALQIGPHDRVLEIGGGCGYAAAVMSHLAATVTTVERYATLADEAERRLRDLGYDNVTMIHGDGVTVLPDDASFDAISIAAAAPAIPPELTSRLRPGGHLIAPVGEDYAPQQLILLHKNEGGEIRRTNLGGVRFVPIVEGTA